MTKIKHQMNPFLKFALEIGPLMIFFITFSRAPAMEFGGVTYKPIIIATGVFMVAIAISLITSYILVRKLPIMPMVTGVVVFIFGGLTIWLNNDLFIKLKPTIVNSLFAAVLLGGLFFGKSLLKPVLEEAFPMNDEGWKKMTLRWGLFFVFLALLNEYVWRNYTTEAWVSFKTFGVMPLTFIFTMAQIPLMNRYMLDPDKEVEQEF